MSINRFSTYLQSQKLAKLHLCEAEILEMKGEHKKAFDHLLKGVREFITATNCIASLAFEPRKKIRKK